MQQAPLKGLSYTTSAKSLKMRRLTLPVRFFGVGFGVLAAPVLVVLSLPALDFGVVVVLVPVCLTAVGVALG